MKLLVALLLVAGVAVAQDPGDLEAGKRHFERNCAACHGADGAGGERGPGILPSLGARTRTREQMRELVTKGIPEAGMPPAVLGEAELRDLLAYVRLLTAPAAESPAPGDAAAGEAFVRGKGDCLRCHMVAGAGGLTGPDLTEIARERTLREIEQALREPSARIAPGFAAASLRLRDGRSLRGLIKNESNYDVQLQTLDGQFHFLRREEVLEIARDQQSLMPAVEASAAEFRDLLAYLTRLSGAGRDRGGAKETPEGVSTKKETPEGVSTTEAAFQIVRNPRRGEWPTYHGHLSGNRHSPLDQITPANVSGLAPRWVFSIPGERRLQVTPVVVDGVMYVTAANQAYALDARTGRQIWRYLRLRSTGLPGDAGGAINRGVAVLGDRIFMVTDNAHLIALHRVTGRLLWDVEMADARQNYGATSAPLVVKDLVISGHSGGDEGVRGFLAAYRASTGERVWRFWTIPAPGEALAKTWIGSALEHGCGSTWLTGAYDPDADLLYWTVGNPCPDYDGDERRGDNLYSDSVLALKPDTGELKWYYQFTPHDVHDWDAQQTPMLIDAEFGGRPRKLLAQASRNGFFYVLDRITGELLLARPFVQKLTWASGIGPDGRPQRLPNTTPTPQGVRVCPTVEGATNWMSTAFHPGAGLFYVMALEKCAIFLKSPDKWEPGKSYFGGSTRAVPGETPKKYLRAIEVKTGRIAWEYPQEGPADSWGGVLSTAGGLVFFGDDSGAFAAADARSGKPLWHFHTSQLWKASPMTYLAGDRQFVAIAAGASILAFALP